VSSWQFRIYLDGGWIDLTNYGGRSLVTRDEIELTQQAHNQGMSVVNSLRFKLIDVPTSLLSALFQTPTYELVPIEVNRDGSRYFTGYLRPVDLSEARAEGAIERTVEAEAVDVLWRVHRSLKEDVRYDNVTVDYVLRQLLDKADVPAGMIAFGATLTTEIQFFEAEEGDEISGLIDALLWEYHHNLYGTTDGRLDLFDWSDDGASPVAVIEESIDKISVEKTDDDYGYVRVKFFGVVDTGEWGSYNSYSFHRSDIGDWGGRSANGLSFSESIELKNPTLGDGFEVIRRENLGLKISYSRMVAGAENYDTNRYGRYSAILNEYDYASLDNRWRWSLRLTTDRSLSGSPQSPYITASINFGNYTLRGRDKNAAAGFASIYGDTDYLVEDVEIEVVGNLVYRERSLEINRSVVGVGSIEARTETIESEYIYDSTVAADLADAALQLRQYGSKRWRIRSASHIPVRSVVTIDSAALGMTSRGRVLRVVDSQRNATRDGLQEYVYTIESLDPVSISDNSVPPGIPSLPAFPPAYPTYPELGDGIDESGPIVELMTPSVAASATLRAVALSIAYPGAITSPSLRYLIQISKDGANWFSLGSGGNGDNDWRNLADEATPVYSPTYTHDNLPLNGSAADPLSTTYYYRVAVATQGLVSDWSAAVSVNVGAAGEMDVAANAITANKIAVGAVTAAKIDVEDLFAQDITMQPGGVIRASNDVWSIEEDRALFSGWELVPGIIQSLDGRTRMRSDLNRFEIRDAMGNVKAARGYLSGLETDSGETFGTDAYGDWHGPGARAVMESGAEYVQGAYNINADAAFVVKTGNIESVRLGSLGSGDIGIDIGGMRFGPLLGGGGATGDFEESVSGGGGSIGTFESFTSGGGSARYGAHAGMQFSLAERRLHLAATLVGADGEFSGSLNAATGTFAGLVSGGSIDIGDGDFTVDSSGNVTAANIDITGGTISGSITATGTISGGTISGATITNGSNFTVDSSGSVVAGDISITSGSIDGPLSVTGDITLSGGDIYAISGEILLATDSYINGNDLYMRAGTGTIFDEVQVKAAGGLASVEVKSTVGGTVKRVALQQFGSIYADLPTSAPGASGLMWRDASGYVRIT
jgi:hypothetical protein